MSSKKAVLGLVANHTEAEAVVDDLRIAGFDTNDISALLPDRSGTRDFAHEQHTKAPEGATAGVGTPASEALLDRVGRPPPREMRNHGHHAE